MKLLKSKINNEVECEEEKPEKWLKWLLTVIIAAISLAISYILFQLEIYFFFLPIIFFIPLARFLRTRQHPHAICPTCGLASKGNYCSRCGTRLYTDGD